MSSEKDLIELVKALGLTIYESKAYVSLLLHGPLTSTELASKGEIPQPRVYDVIKNLVEKGLVVVLHGRPRKFRALNPEVALKNYIENRFLNESNIYTKIINVIKNKPFIKDEEGVWITSSTSGIISMIKEAINDAENELLIATNKEILNQILELLSKKDISICLVMYDVDENYSEKLKNLVDEIRIRPTKGPTLFIPDIKYAVAIVGWGSQVTAYKITDEHLKTLFSEYFLGYVRINSTPIASRFANVLSRDYVNLVRAVDHIRVLQEHGHKVKITVEGRLVKTGEPVTITGTPISYKENSIKGITSLILKMENGNEITVGGLGAHLEDVEAIKIHIKTI